MPNLVAEYLNLAIVAATLALAIATYVKTFVHRRPDDAGCPTEKARSHETVTTPGDVDANSTKPDEAGRKSTKPE